MGFEEHINISGSHVCIGRSGISISSFREEDKPYVQIYRNMKRMQIGFKFSASKVDGGYSVGKSNFLSIYSNTLMDHFPWMVSIFDSDIKDRRFPVTKEGDLYVATVVSPGDDIPLLVSVDRSSVKEFIEKHSKGLYEDVWELIPSKNRNITSKNVLLNTDRSLTFSPTVACDMKITEKPFVTVMVDHDERKIQLTFHTQEQSGCFKFRGNTNTISIKGSSIPWLPDPYRVPVEKRKFKVTYSGESMAIISFKKAL